MHKDYYSLLGISISAEPELIDKAYRILAKRWHPDQGGTTADLHRFEQLQEAYNVLSDPAMRAMYDRGTIEANSDSGKTPQASTPGHTFQILRLRFEQALRGGKVTVNMLSGRHPQRIDVAVPCGVEPGDRIRIQGVAPPDSAGAPPNDLILIIDIRPHPDMYRRGLDLYANTPVPLDIAINGGVVPFNTPDGDVEIEIPPHTTTGKKILLRNRGIADARGKRGDLYAVVQISLPRDKNKLKGLTLQPDNPQHTTPSHTTTEHQSPLHIEAAELETQKADLHKQQTLLEQNRRMIEEQASLLSQQQREADEQQQHLTSSRRELASTRHQLDARQAELDQRAKLLDDQFKLTEKRSADLDKLESDLRSQSDKIESDRLSHLADQDRLNDHRNSLELLREELTAESRRQDQHRAFLDDRANDIDERKEALDGFRAELDQQAARLDEVQAACEDKAAELMAIEKQLESRSTHIERDERRLSEDRAALDKRLTEADALQQQLNANQQSIAMDRQQLSNDLQQLESQRRELESTRDRINNLQNVQAASAGNRHTMDEQAEQLERTKAEVQAANMRLSAERQRLSRERSELATARASLAAARDQIGSDLSRIESERRSLQSLHDAVIAARAETDRRQSALAEQAAQHAELQQRAKRLETRLAEAEQRTEQHRQRAEQAERTAASQPTTTTNPTNNTSTPSASTPPLAAAPEGRSVKPKVKTTTTKQPQDATQPIAAPNQKSEINNQQSPTLPRFAFHRAGRHAAADASPNHLRTAACYIDRTGTRHLIADSIDTTHNPTNNPKQNTTATWAATLQSFRAEPGTPFQSQGHAIKPGPFNPQNTEQSAPDCFGTASPAILQTSNLVLLAYAGRGNCEPNTKPAILAGPDKPNRLISRIMLAAAPADTNGAPAAPFTKLGSIIEPHPPFATLRVDHPSLIIHNNQLHILYTAYDSALDLSHRVLGHASANLNQLTKQIQQQLAQTTNTNNEPLAQLFTIDTTPSLAVEAGGETPRLFHHQNNIHLLYRHFDRTHGSRWRHHTTNDLTNFTLNDPNLFDGLADPDNDVTPVIDTQGKLAQGQNLYVSGTELNSYKQWAFELRISR